MRFKYIPNKAICPQHSILKYSFQAQRSHLESFWYRTHRLKWHGKFPPPSLSLRFQLLDDDTCRILVERNTSITSKKWFVFVYGNWAIVLKSKLILIEDRKKRKKSTRIYRLTTTPPRNRQCIDESEGDKFKSNDHYIRSSYAKCRLRIIFALE